VGDPRLSPFRGPALAFAAYLVVQAGSAAVLFAQKLGTTPDRVAEFYLGAEERFALPKSLPGLLEVAVPHLLAIPLVLFAASHVVGFARALGRGPFVALVAVSFGSAGAGISAGFLIRFVLPDLAWIKIAAFAGLEASLLAWAALLAALFVPRRKPARLPDAGGAGEVAR
jgi:hypothetical protein